jgi:probable HAF family extracellular repeat protein
MVGLGFLPGGLNSQAHGVSADGSVVVGTASVGSGGEAFRWTPSGGMVGLGFLSAGSNTSTAFAVSGNGAVVVGMSGVVDVNVQFQSYTEAFRWTQAGGMVGLGFLPGGAPSSTLSSVSAAFAVNADGSVVVGNSNSGSSSIGRAFRWTQNGGMQSIQSLLVAGGVNMTGWTLTNPTGVSADGTVIVGTDLDPSGQQEAWLARFSAQFGTGLITPGVAAQSFAGQAAVAQTGNAVIGGSLATMSEYATQAHNTQATRTTPYSVFAYANYDSDPSASGTFGMTVDLPDAMVAGATASANYINTNLVYDGSAKMWGGSLGAFLARVPDAGLQWLLGVNGTTLSGDINRGYLNGSGQAYSQGSTTANGYGATARIGWSFNNVLPATQVTPFASYTISTIHFNGYTETTGVFPAQFNGFNDTAQIARFGADMRYTLAPGKWVWGTLASAHRLDNSETEDITGTLIGMFGVTAPAGPVANDWVEATVGIRWPAWKDGAMAASLTASIPANYATTYVARVGVSQMF